VPEVRAEWSGQPCPRRILVACSGGADSVFLLCLLAGRAEQDGLELAVAHYNHRWRGQASVDDAAFVGRMAAALELPYREASRPEKEAAFTETAARSLRLDFLRQSAAELDCSWIALGHQLDDILETQLQRLARGSGTEGLAAPRPVSRFDGLPTHLRPLFGMRAGDIRMRLRALEIPWREDASNADIRIARNALRAEIIPGLTEALDRDPAAGAARSRRLLEEDAALLDELAREAMPAAYAGADTLSRTELAALPPALLRRALNAWLARHDLLRHLGPAALDRLLEQCVSGPVSGRFSAGAAFLRFSRERLRIESVETEEAHQGLTPTPLEPGATLFLPGGGSLHSEVLRSGPELLERVLQGQVDPALEAIMSLPRALPLEVRPWQPGDRFHPLGAPGSRKLQDWFVDHQIPVAERKRLPVVTTGSGEILWVPGSPPAERHKLTAATKRALRLTYRPENPL